MPSSFLVRCRVYATSKLRKMLYACVKLMSVPTIRNCHIQRQFCRLNRSK